MFTDYRQSAAAAALSCTVPIDVSDGLLIKLQVSRCLNDPRNEVNDIINTGRGVMDIY